MMRRPRGTCVIINNRDFHNNVLAQRRGSELDVQRMRMLFQELDFVCIIRLNQTKEVDICFTHEHCFHEHEQDARRSGECGKAKLSKQYSKLVA